MGDQDWRRETIDWEGYADFPLPYDGSFSALAKAQARATFDHMMSIRESRRGQLRQLLENNGHPANSTAALLTGVESLIREHVTRDPDDPEFLEKQWYPVILDASLVLGDEYIRHYPSLYWALGGGGRRMISFQHPVVTGFQNFGTKVKRWEIPVITLVDTFAWSSVRGREPYGLVQGIKESAKYV